MQQPDDHHGLLAPAIVEAGLPTSGLEFFPPEPFEQPRGRNGTSGCDGPDDPVLGLCAQPGDLELPGQLKQTSAGQCCQDSPPLYHC